MNELFFSAMFIGGLLFSNSEINEIPSEININHIENPASDSKGNIELISNRNKTLTFKVTGDQINDRLEIFVNNQTYNTSIENGEFKIEHPKDNKNHSCLVELKSTNRGVENNYASYVISF